MDASPLKHIKGYEIRERIGAGGFGAVYKAYQTTVGRDVAIKVILPDRANQPDFIRRFESEAQIVARLEHPYIVPLYDFWRDPDGAFLVMRWLRGGSVRDALTQGAFEPRTAALLLDQIAGALALAHRSGVIHRDLKPGNILLDEEGNGYLTDFGIAKTLSVNGEQTDPDTILGSIDYISPEQARSEPVTVRTDIYSLGVTLYEIITGQHPFPHMSSIERMYRHINDPLPEITTLDPALNTAVNAVIQKATAKNPDLRYPDALALAAAFREAVGLNRTSTSAVEVLTLREQEILALIVDGLANKEIAQKLTLTVGTVKWHIYQIYNKLGVRSRVQAIVRARDLHLITPPGEEAATVVVHTDSFQPKTPYKGLLPFQSADNQDFFGRERFTARLIKRLSETGDYSRFLAVVGPSGSGKSSLVKAGLIPALWRGDIPGSERWFVVEMIPGTHPLDELEVALTRVAANQAANLNDQLTRDNRGLVRTAGLILPNDGSDLVLVIDQFEEAFTLVAEETERKHFLDLLYTAVTEPRSRVRIVITLRADFYDRPLHYPQFGEMVRSRLETILPLSAEDLERAITLPAERVGVSFEPGLVTTIVGDVNYQPGALPLLQYALTELFEAREGRLLTREAYHTIGGTIGALARRADEVFLELGAREQAAAQQIFLRLVTLGDGTEDTRRRAPRSELKAVVEDDDLLDDIVEAFAAYRLLALDTDPGTRSPTVELAHEALIREWERLRTWLNSAREDIKQQRQITALSADWHDHDRDPGLLVRGARLRQFTSWAEGTTLALTPREREFLSASAAEHERQQQVEIAQREREIALERRSRALLRGLVAVLAVALVGALMLSGVALSNADEARRNAALADQERQNVQSALATSDANFARAEQQRLALAADEAMDDGASGNIGLALALRSLAYGYTETADAAIARASHQGIVRHRLTGHQFDIYSIRYSRDGTLLALSGESRTIVYDAISGQPLHELPNQGIAWSVGFVPASSLLVVASDGGVVIWNAATGEQMRTLIEGKDAFHVTFLSGGQRMFTADRDEVIVWDTTTWEALERRPRITAEVEIMLAVDGGTGETWWLLKEYATERVTLVDEENSEQCELLPDSGRAVRMARFFTATDSDRPLLLLTAANDTEQQYRIHAFEYMDCTALPVFDQHQAWIFGIDYDAAHDVVMSIDELGTTHLWRLADQRILSTITLNERSIDLEISPDGSQLAVNQFSTGLVYDLSVPADPRILQVSPDQNGFTFFANFAPDGESLYVGGFGMLSRWSLDENTGQPLMVFDGYPGVITVSPDGQTIAAVMDGTFTATEDNTVYLIDGLTGEVIRTFTGHTDPVNFMDFSPDGTLLATPSFDLTARIWDVATGEMLHILEGHEGVVSEVEFSGDGSRLLSTSSDGTVRIWDVATGEQVQQLDHGAPMPGAGFSPDGRRIVVGDTDGSVVMWDAVSGERLATLGNHGQPVWSVNYSPDGTLVVSAGFDGTARIWDGETGALVRVLDNGAENGLFWAEFSPDSRTVVTGGEQDDRVYLWRVSLDETISALCGMDLPALSLEDRAKYGIMDDGEICPPSSNSST